MFANRPEKIDEKQLYEICFYVYGFCMTLVFVFSSAYHWVSWLQSTWTNLKVCLQHLKNCDLSLFFQLKKLYNSFKNLTDL